jgi:DNA-binding MarR family transcriptional regulator
MPSKTKSALQKLGDPEPTTKAAPRVFDLDRVRQRRRAANKSRQTGDKHTYFMGVAEARYVLRKAFRIVEEQAKSVGIDPLAHQALIQVYGSPEMELQVNQIANRLDIPPALASSLVRVLVEKGLAIRRRNDKDQRVTCVGITDSGKELLHGIDEQVQYHVDYFAGQLTRSERESALNILTFYVGANL